MKQFPDLKLRKMGSKYMIVKAGSGQVNMSEVFMLNETAARLWELVEGREFTADELVAWLASHYEVGEVAARQDIDRLLDTWKKFGLIG